MKNIWILCHHTTPPEFGHFTRHHNLSLHLKEKGYNPTIFAGSVPHNTDTQLIEGKEKYKVYDKYTFPFVFIKTCLYNRSGKKRLLAMYQYCANVFSVTKKMIKSGSEKPDVIMGSSGHIFVPVVAIYIAKKLKVPCVVEVRDLWPESIVVYSSKYTKNHPIIKMLYKLEKWIYKKADKIVFTMEGGAKYIQNQGWDNEIDLKKVHHINNGVDLKAFDYNKEHYTIEDKDLDDDSTFKIVYTGSIRRVNNLGIIIDAAKKIQDKNIKFLIWGGGDELEKLQNRVKDENVDNVVFKGSVEKKYIPYILSKSNLNILHYEYSSVFKYGTSQNKNFEYLASGTPVLNTIKIGYDVVEKNNAGISIETQSVDNICNSIMKLYEMDKAEFEQMCKNARKVAEEYDFSNLTKRLIDVIEDI